MACVIAVTSGKGGTGKTSITGAVAGSLSLMGRRVLCIDMDIGLRNLDITLGLNDRALMDFSDVALGRCPLARAAVTHPELKNLSLLTAPMSLPAGLTPDKVQALLNTARGAYDYIFIDSPAGLEGLRQVHLVMNRIQPKLLRKLRTTIDDAMNAAGLPLIGVVPEDPQVILCANQGIPLAGRSHRGAALACWNVAQRLEGRQVPVMRIR